MKLKRSYALLTAVLLLLLSGCEHQSMLNSNVEDEKSLLRYPVLYLDLDGTALDTNGTVRQSTINAVEEFKARGGRVGIATGRTYEQAEAAIKVIKPNLPVVLFNGGVAAEPDGSQFTTLGSLNRESILLCDSLVNENSGAYGYILHFPSTTVLNNSSEELNSFAQSNDITFAYKNDIHSFSPDSLIKILVVCPETKTESVKELLVNSIHGGARVVVSCPNCVEILPAGVSKASALQHIAEGSGFTMQDIIAFGDSGNDVEMVSEAGLGVAMSNGRTETLNAADIIAGPNYTDAIAKLISSQLMFTK